MVTTLSMANRYYDSGADGEVKPGKISAELREALNIAENDIPLWIYRMRALGYPPGWLKKAIVDTSDIFDTDTSIEEKTKTTADNNKSSNSHTATPESSSSNSNKRKTPPTNEEVQYDHSKLIEYPGFNMPMPKNCVDYHYYINMPAMLEHQQLEYAKKHMNSFKPSLNTSASSIKSKSSLNQEHKKAKLNKDDDNKDKDKKEDEEEEEGEEDVKIVNNSTTTTTSNDMTNSIVGEEIKLLSKGSPMPKPVKRAPLEKFSEGIVGDLLYFENLPASSGKFDSIRELLNKMNDSTSSTEK